MSYVYDFDVGTVFFFGLTIFFYQYEKRLRSLQDRLFTAMLICAMTSVVFDAVSEALRADAMRWPLWVLYVSNMLFIFGMQTCLPLFLLYSAASSNRLDRLSRAGVLLGAAPYALTMLALFISPFVHFGIFTFSPAHIYRRGPLHSMLQLDAALYVPAGLAVLLQNRRSVQPAQRTAIVLLSCVLFAAMALQPVFPRYLPAASAIALALTAVFHALRPAMYSSARTLLPAEGRAVLRLLPICTPDGAVAANEAWLEAPAAQRSSAAHPAHVASRSGSAWEYYRTLLTALNERGLFSKDNAPIYIALLPAVLLKEDFAGEMTALAASLGCRPERIVFSVTESEIASSGAALAERIKRLAARGFPLMIDALADGYTDMALVASLPLRWARLRDSFTQSAVGSANDAKLLAGLISVLADMGIEAVCAGVNTEAQRRACVDAGARLLQGERAKG